MQRNMVSQDGLAQILAEYRMRLEEVLGDSLNSVILYGSQARADATLDSDVDVLCVMNEPVDYGELIKKTSYVTAELSLKYDVVLSRSFVSVQDYHARQRTFLMNVRREGVPV